MKFMNILGAMLWALLGITAICGVWTPSLASYGIATFTIVAMLIGSACGQ